MFGDYKRFKVTYTLIGLNILVYLFLILTTGETLEMSADTLVAYGALYAPLVFMEGEWRRIAVAIFLHGGMIHLLMNMVSLFIVGRPSELFFTAKEYLMLYFLSGFAGAMASVYFHPDTVSIGASGAIFGIFGALFGYLLFAPNRAGEQKSALLKNFGIIVGLNLALGFGLPGIDMSAHIAGLLVGAIGGIVLARYPRYFLIFSAGIGSLIGVSFVYLSTLFANFA